MCWVSHKVRLEHSGSQVWDREGVPSHLCIKADRILNEFDSECNSLVSDLDQIRVPKWSTMWIQCGVHIGADSGFGSRLGFDSGSQYGSNSDPVWVQVGADIGIQLRSRLDSHLDSNLYSIWIHLGSQYGLLQVTDIFRDSGRTLFLSVTLSSSFAQESENGRGKRLLFFPNGLGQVIQENT